MKLSLSCSFALCSAPAPAPCCESWAAGFTGPLGATRCPPASFFTTKLTRHLRNHGGRKHRGKSEKRKIIRKDTFTRRDINPPQLCLRQHPYLWRNGALQQGGGTQPSPFHCEGKPAGKNNFGFKTFVFSSLTVLLHLKMKQSSELNHQRSKITLTLLISV